MPTRTTKAIITLAAVYLLEKSWGTMGLPSTCCIVYAIRQMISIIHTKPT